MPQPKHIYLEQIEVLKPILKTMNKNSLGESSNKNFNNSIIDITHSPIVSDKKRISNKGKTTMFNSEKHSSSQMKIQKGTMMEKLEKAAPYNIFFTTIIKAPQTCEQPNAVTFPG